MKRNILRLITLGFIAIACLQFSATAKAEDTVVASGTFEGRSKHDVSGGVSVRKTESGYVVVLAKDFSLDSAPDPKLGFGKDGYKKKSQFSKLNKHKGEQTYTLPKDVDPSAYNEIWVWCEKFDVPLGVAKLK